jgi:predicted CXXCH cytochrome family protein
MPFTVKRPYHTFIFILSGWMLISLTGCGDNPEGGGSKPKDSTYVGSRACISCHPGAYQDWLQSDHFQAMQLATDSFVLGDFDNTTLIADGVTSTFFKKDNKYFINTQGDDGLNHDYEIAYTFGFFPLQQYLIAFPNGRLQTTRASWDSRENKWFHQYADQTIDHRDWLHWTGASQNWNTMCASCHSTHLQKNYDGDTDSFATTWDEINVSCESCHGPGSTHIDYVNSKSYGKGTPTVNSGLLYGRDTIARIQVNACASCHARKSDISSDLIHSEELLDDLIPQVISNEFYFSDGQILEEDYVYGSFTQSKMFHQNVRCTNCHNPHSGKLIAEGNNLCLNCHTSNYNTSQHHHHQPDSEGATCVNCHMVARTYMGNDHRRDHSFRVPRPDQSVRYGTPNACIQCHQEKTNAWASQNVVNWYGPKRTYHFSDDLIPGSVLDGQSESHLIALLENTMQPAIARATAAYYLGQIQTMKSVLVLLTATSDSMAIVRYHALRAMENFPPELWTNKVTDALRDKVRAVRIAAADLYHRLPPDEIPANAKETFTNAEQENKDFLYYQADFSVGNVMIADYELQGGDYQRAIRYYRRGLAMDSLMNYARLNLATVYSIVGENEKALEALMQARAIDSMNERIHYNLGLLQYEMDDVATALQSFQRAVALGSLNPSLYYNYGLALEQASKFKEAERIFLKGYAIDTNAIPINYALALLYIQQNRPEEARGYAQFLKARDPDNPDFQPLFQALHL